MSSANLLMRFAMDKQGIGFLTIAQNTDKVDYLRLAYVQALQCKVTNPNLAYAVIVDRTTHKDLPKLKHSPFDKILILEEDLNHEGSQWKLANECQMFNLTPFKETIKIESDLLFPKTIDHLLPALRSRDLVIALGCKNYQNKISNVRTYRKFFDENHLPDLYSGLIYFRYSKFAAEFYKLVKTIMLQWKDISNYALKNSREEYPSTDVLFALAAMIMGVERCCIPTLDAFSFIHLKPAINQWLNNTEWHTAFMYEFDNTILRLNNLNLLDITHYQDKNFINSHVIQHFEQLYEQRI